MNKKLYSSPLVETAPLLLSACIMSGGVPVEAGSGDSGHNDPVPGGHHAPGRVF